MGADTPADFQALQGAFDSARTGNIVYYLFDLPYCAGHDLRECALEDRRAVLRRIVERTPHDKVRFSEVFDAPPQARDFVAAWVDIGRPAFEAAPGKKLSEVEIGVVRLSLANLMSFPWIAELVAGGRLSLQGFIFDIHTGVLTRVTAEGADPVP